MRAKTTHVLPENGGWAIKRQGSPTSRTIGVYPTQKEAILAARALVRRGYRGEVVIHHRSGSTTSKEFYLPAIQRSAVKSSLGRRAIKKAVYAVIRERLARERLAGE